ncbi:MAG: NAD(P)/FAD-dependent oxidoreductase [Peptococcaceae bacterium]|nr:NAD(P)/FAD-dependent oxidoreductase [Peptococcaceae bacterium]
MQDVYDIAIVGAGPAGLSAAINGIQRGKTAVLVNSGRNALSRAELLTNYLGLPAVSGREAMEAYTKHALGMGAEIKEGRVTNILPFGDKFMVSFGSDVVTARTVILATGALISKTVENEEKFLGRGLSYCATCDGILYKGKKVLVYGLGDASVEEANYLAGLGCQVIFVGHVSHSQELQEGIEQHCGILRALRGEAKVSSADVAIFACPPNKEQLEDRPLVERHTKTFFVDGVFILRNALAPEALLKDLELAEGCIKVNEKMQTNIPGIYACGDCASPLRQVAKAVGDGLIAGQEAARYLDGR